MLDVMFDIGFGEMILLAAIALIAIGPKQLPEVARTVGKLLGEFKKAVGDVTSTVANAREETDRAIRKVTSDLTDVTHDLSNSIHKHPEAKPVHRDSPPPIVTLADHPGDPPWVVDPSIPNPNLVSTAADVPPVPVLRDDASASVKKTTTGETT